MASGSIESRHVYFLNTNGCLSFASEETGRGCTFRINPGVLLFGTDVFAVFVTGETFVSTWGAVCSSVSCGSTVSMYRIGTLFSSSRFDSGFQERGTRLKRGGECSPYILLTYTLSAVSGEAIDGSYQRTVISETICLDIVLHYLPNY